MLGFKWPWKRLSEDETRTLLLSLVSTGCLLIAKAEGQISERQNYFLLSTLYCWLDKEDGNEAHNKEVGYLLVDQVAKINDYTSIAYLFNDGKQLPKKSRIHVIQLCMTFSLLGYDAPDRAMGLIGHLTRDIGLSVNVPKSLLSECIEVAGTHSVMAMYSKGYEESLRLLQQAFKRAATSSIVNTDLFD